MRRRVPPEAKFCIECGSSLAASRPTQPPAPAPAATSPRPRRGPAPAEPEELPEERRQVTVLFADLSGYTAVAERMDPEPVKALVDGALRRLAQEVERYGGSVDKYIGDNVMALFGAPVAHEDDAERAVRAGLAMQEAMGEINERSRPTHGVTFKLRVGINTGEVVAGRSATATRSSATPSTSRRVCRPRRAGSVTVGERTFRDHANAIDYESWSR